MTPNVHLRAVPNEDKLNDLNHRIRKVCDVVTGVAEKYKTGLFLYGKGGVGKSHTVLSHLAKINKKYVLHNSRMSPKGMFVTFKENPDAVHVMEDMEQTLKDPIIQGILRSACWAQPGHDRLITWTTATDGAVRFAFKGGLIMISNVPLAKVPALSALAGRIEVLQLDIPEDEMEALMRHLAAQGYRHPLGLSLTAEECEEATEYLLHQSRAAGYPLDLRLQQKAFATYLQWQQGDAECHWQELVAASVEEAVSNFKLDASTAPASKEEEIEREIEFVRTLVAEEPDVGEQYKKFKALTKKSKAVFFRRKQEVER